jgi:hypothetical protein
VGVKLGLSGKMLFETIVLRRTFVSDRKVKEQKDGENHIRRSFSLRYTPAGHSYSGE